jgi:hypothetical protein
VIERLEDRFALAAPVAVNDAYSVVGGRSLESTASSALPAGAVVWRTQDGGNGHAYLSVAAPGGISWTSARDAAIAMGGHLATITSVGENNFIRANLPLVRGWIGGFQDHNSPSYSEPAGGWTWITGEPWGFTHWIATEPNEFIAAEDYLEIETNAEHRWNDITNVNSYTMGYYVEFPISKRGVLANDIDIDGDALTATLVSNASNGALNLNVDGSFAYTPEVGFIGTDSFTYRASDGLLDSNVATVTITVREDLPPVAADDAYSVIHGRSLEAISLPAGAVVWHTQDGGNGHAYFLVPAPSGITWTSARNAAIAMGGHLATITSAAENDFVRAELPAASGWIGAFQDHNAPSYSEPDGGWTWVTGEPWAFTHWDAGEPNETPAGEDYVHTWSNGERRWNDLRDIVSKLTTSYYVELSAATVLFNDTDADGDVLSATLVSNVTNGTLNLSSEGSFTYTPNSGFIGVDTFTYRANDGLSDSNVATVTIQVSTPALPVAVDDSYHMAQGRTLTGDALANDLNPYGVAITATLLSSPNHGTLAFASDGKFSYTPATGFTGADLFTYQLQNAAGQSSPATVRITIARTITPDFVVPLIPVTTPIPGVSSSYVALPFAGGFYFVGGFFGTVDFDPGPGVSALSSTGFQDAFIALYTPEGLVWVRQIGGADYERVRSMAVDRDGNVYVKGDSDAGPVSFGGTIVATQPLSLFFVKLDLNGDFSWIITPTGTRNNRSLAVDDTSEDRSQWSVYTVPLEPAETVGNIPYYTKLSAQTGQIIDTLEYIPLDPRDSYVMEDVFVDDRGLVTTVGYSVYYLGDAATGGTEITRWDNNFNILWSGGFPGTAQQRKQQVVVDAQGNTYVEAIFRGTVGFTPPDHLHDVASRGTGSNAYVSALDDAGNWKWATVLGSTETVEGAQIALALDATGNILTAGRFWGVADFGNIQLVSAGGWDAYVAYLDRTDGEVLGAWRMGGISTSYDFTGSVGTDAEGNTIAEFGVGDAAEVPTGETLTRGQYILKFRAASTTPVQGDITGDGRIDRDDVAIAAARFGSPVFIGAAGGDFDGDGRLSLFDVAILQQNLTLIAAPSPQPVASSPSMGLGRSGTGLVETRSIAHARSRAEMLSWLTHLHNGALDGAKLRGSKRARESPRQVQATVDRVLAQTESWDAPRKRAGPLRASRVTKKAPATPAIN